MNVFKRYLLPVIALLIIGFSSCYSNEEASGEAKIEGEVWPVKNTQIFNLSVNDLDSYYNIFINVNVKEDFLTNNLWLFITTISPSGKVQSDSVMYYVTDEKGKWYGKKYRSCISNKFLYKSFIKFPEKGVYEFKLEHGMREKDLPKITKLGVSIQYAKKSND